MRRLFYVAAFLLALTACTIFGVHKKIHNPHRPGKYPKQTEALLLLANQESRYRTCFDVTYYYLSVRFGFDLSNDKSIRGSVGIKAIAKTDFDTLQLDLKQPMHVHGLHEGSISPTGIAVDDTLHYFRKEGALFVVFPKTVRKGATVSMVVDFSGIPVEAHKPPWEGGFVRRKDDLGQPWWGVCCETEGASSWWPCKDVMNDEPDSVDVDLWVPDGLVAVSNGKSVDPRTRYFSGPAPVHSSNNLVPFCWHISYPINLYNITFYIGNFKLLHDDYVSAVTHDTLALNHYVLGQHYDKAKQQFKQVKDQLNFYEETFGPYAFYRDGFKLVESPFEGMEHQSAIAYGNGFETTIWGFDYIILHESAHEWWGNAVTAYDLADGWLHEGFATYCEALYVEKKYGPKMYVQYLLDDRPYIINRRPIIAPYGIRYFDYRDGDMYMKGAWVLHSLRTAMRNDSLFFDVLRAFYTNSMYKIVRTEDFEQLVKTKTGEDYNWFFDQYLRNRFVPELEYCVSGGVLYYRWNPERTNSSFNQLPTPYWVNKPTPGWQYTVPVTPNATVQRKTLQANAERVGFDNSKALFKPVENKKLVKLFRAQSSPR